MSMYVCRVVGGVALNQSALPFDGFDATGPTGHGVDEPSTEYTSMATDVAVAKLAPSTRTDPIGTYIMPFSGTFGMAGIGNTFPPMVFFNVVIRAVSTTPDVNQHPPE